MDGGGVLDANGSEDGETAADWPTEAPAGVVPGSVPEEPDDGRDANEQLPLTPLGSKPSPGSATSEQTSEASRRDTKPGSTSAPEELSSTRNCETAHQGEAKEPGEHAGDVEHRHTAGQPAGGRGPTGDASRIGQEHKLRETTLSPGGAFHLDHTPPDATPAEDSKADYSSRNAENAMVKSVANLRASTMRNLHAQASMRNVMTKLKPESLSYGLFSYNADHHAHPSELEDPSGHGSWGSHDTSRHGPSIRRAAPSAVLDKKEKPLKSILRDVSMHGGEAQGEKREDLTLTKKNAELLLRERKTVRFHLGSRWKARMALPPVRRDSDPLVQGWHMFFVLPLAYETWAFPFRCALCSPGNNLLLFTDVASDVFFLIDAIFHAFVMEDRLARRKRSRLRLFQEYLYRQSLSTILPSAVFYALTNSHTPLWLWMLSGVPRFLPRLFRLVRYFQKMQMNLNVDMKRLQIVKFIAVLTLSCHWVGCTYYWIARILEFRDNTWVGQFEATMPGVFHRELSPWWEHYVAILYRGWIGLAPNSYRRPPQNWPEQLFSVAVMFMAMTLSAYLLGTVLPHIVKKDVQLEEYVARRKRLLKFAASRELPPSLVNKILTYYEFQFSKIRRGSAHIKMPRALSEKVANKRFRRFVDSNCLRHFCFHGCETNFLSAMTCMLSELYLMPGEEFMRKGDVARELCFVADGVVQMMGVDDKKEVKKEIRSDIADQSTIVGEISFFFGIPHMQTGRASSDAEVKLLVLSQDDSEKLLGQYPEQEDLILRNILASYNLDKSGARLSDMFVVDETDTIHELQRDAIVQALKRKNEESFTSLSFAVTHGYMVQVKDLMRRGTDLNQSNYDARSALHMAAFEGNIRIVETLIDGDANVNLRNRWHRTPLAEAVQSNQPHVVQLLLKCGAKLLLEDPSGEMCDYASKGDSDNMLLLLNNGVDPNAKDYDSRSALHLAAAEGKDKIVELLLQFKADVNIKDRWGGTPLLDAIVGGHPVVAETLRARGGKLPDGVDAEHMCNAAALGDLRRLQMLLACGCDPDEGNYDLRTPLHLACANANVVVVAFLLGQDCTVNIGDRWNGTPLDNCVRGGTLYHVYCGKLLQGYGGVLGVYENSEQGFNFLNRMQEISIDEVVRKKRAIGRSLAMRKSAPSNATSKLRSNKTPEHDRNVANEASLDILCRLVTPIRESLDVFMNELQECGDSLDHGQEKVKHFLYVLADAIDSTGMDITLLPSHTFDASTSGATSAEPEDTLRARLNALSQSLDDKSGDEMQSNILLASVIDDETYKLYEEVDKIARDTEFRLTWNQGDPFLIRAFDKCVLHMNEITESYNVLEECFALIQPSRAYKTEKDLSIILESLGFRMTHQQAEAMIYETGSTTASLSDLLCKSDHFRALLLGADGTCFAEHHVEWRYLKCCHAITCLPIWWLMQATKSALSHKRYAKDTTILEAGRFTDDLLFIEKGEVRVENNHGKLICMLKAHDVLGELEFFCGTKVSYRATASTDVTVMRLQKSFVSKAFGDAGQYLVNVADALIEFVELMSSTSKQELVQGFTRPNEMSRDDFRNTYTSQLAKRFLPDTILPVDLKREIDLARDVLPGIHVISNCWDAFADSEDTMNLKDLLALSGKTGEVGNHFTETFKRSIYQVLKERIQREHVNEDETQVHEEDMEAMLKSLGMLFEYNVDEDQREDHVADSEFRITSQDWWEAWTHFLRGELPEEDSTKLSIQRLSHASSIMMAKNEHDLLEIGVLETSWSYVTGSRISSQLLDPEVLDRYEAAYVMIVGNLSERMQLDEIPDYIRLLLPKKKTVSNVNVGELLVLFGQEGLESSNLTWTGIRKVVRERNRELTSRTQSEPIFADQSSIVLNSNSLAMRVWRYFVRLVSVYHFLAVPFRITFHPFESPRDRLLWCTDGVADVVILLYMLVKLNTAYLNKKSKWVHNRYKILKHYFGDGSCIRDVIIVMPIDWMCLSLGVPMRSAQWLRIPKMFFMQSTKGSSTAHFGGLKNLATTAALELHLGAVTWAFLGLLKTERYASTLETTWYTAPSAQAFLNGVSMDGIPSDDGPLSMWELYAQALNWASTHTVSTVGNATLCPKNYLEVGFAMIMMTVSMTFYKMFLGKLSAHIMQNDQNIIKIRGDLSALQTYVSRNHLDEDKNLVEEIYKNFEVKNNPNNVDTAEIFDNLSSSLQFELSALLCKNVLDHVDLFKGCCEAVLDGLCTALREVVFDPEEIIFNINGVAEDMYLVSFGSVDILEESDDGKGVMKVSKVMKKGSAVGDVSFAFGTTHIYSARAAAGTGATCWKLTRKSYLAILKLFPEDLDLVTSNSLHSFEIAKDLKAAAASRRSRSIKGRDYQNFEVSLEKEPEERSINSDLASDPSSANADDIMGSQLSAQIETLKQHQKNAVTHQMMNAAFHGDLQKIRSLLTRFSWVNVNTTDESGRGALHVAASEGHAEVVKFLLSNRADANMKDRYANTPLNDAVRHKHDEVAAVIRRQVPGITVVFPGCMAAVHLLTCSFGGDLQGIKRLVDNGVEVNAQDYDNRSALHLAACEGHTHVVEYLLQAKANPGARDRFGGTALHDSVRHEQVAIHQYLKDAGCELTGMDTALLLCKTAAAGNLEKMKNLVDNRVDPNLCDQDGRTALHLASCNGCIDIINFLLKHTPSINVNPVDMMGGTPLDDANRHKQRVAITMLQTVGALQEGDEQIPALIKLQQQSISRKGRSARISEVVDRAMKSPELVYYQVFSETIVASYRGEKTGDRLRPETPREDSGTACDGNDGQQETVPFWKLAQDLKRLLVDLKIAMNDLTAHVRSKAMRAATGHARWSSMKSLVKSHLKSDQREFAQLNAAVENAVHSLLVLLASLYQAIPELPETSPKLFQLLSTQYGKERAMIQRKILKCSSLLLQLPVWVQDYKHAEEFRMQPMVSPAQPPLEPGAGPAT